MTGKNDRSWNSLDRVIAPALLASIEAAWVSIWIGGVWYASAGSVLTFLRCSRFGRDDCDCAGSLAGVFVARDRLRLRLRVVLGLVVGTMSAGVIGVLYLHGSFQAFGLHPWTVLPGPASSESAAGWFVAAIAVSARAAGSGSGRAWSPTRRGLLVVATVAFVVFFFVAVNTVLKLHFQARSVPAKCCCSFVSVRDRTARSCKRA